ncbi:hypothetical protein Taro_029687 [Colocasia esculenta]|uniref:Uncharacterized protein n=1 Tax=Colocasia esculenta TaxID=4460 RepID=A0A843VEF4_COLES|nr:hypothetical protein [Colocasia esculenta]
MGIVEVFSSSNSLSNHQQVVVEEHRSSKVVVLVGLHSCLSCSCGAAAGPSVCGCEPESYPTEPVTCEAHPYSQQVKARRRFHYRLPVQSRVAAVLGRHLQQCSFLFSVVSRGYGSFAGDGLGSLQNVSVGKELQLGAISSFLSAQELLKKTVEITVSASSSPVALLLVVLLLHIAS